MQSDPIAVCTFFSKTTCGYCKQFKGESTDNSGTVKIDPNSGWETLTSDLDLQNMGVVFNLYQFGPEKDPRTGKVLNYVLGAPYSDKGRIRGVPHLELSIPNQPNEYVPFDPAGLTGWEASKSVPVMKKWIIQALQTDRFKSYANDVRSGKHVRASHPSGSGQSESSEHVQQAVQARRPPVVQDNSSQRVAQIQAQQRQHQHGEQSPQVHAPHHHHHHASGQHHHHVQQAQEQEVQEPEEDSDEAQQQPAVEARQQQQAPRRQVQQRSAPTTFGMGTQKIRPVVTPNSVPVSPARQNAHPPSQKAESQKVVEKPRPRFVPANYDE